MPSDPPIELRSVYLGTVMLFFKPRESVYLQYVSRHWRNKPRIIGDNSVFT
jgi:hypothetical protein